METAAVLRVLNREPEKWLRADTTKGIEIEIDGVQCLVVRNNIQGGVVVFFKGKGGSLCLSWNKEANRWQA